MITNERQYRMTKGWVERFAQAQDGVEAQRDTLHPRAAQALRDQYGSQIEELQAELADYEALRQGEVIALTLNSLTELPEALIRARTAAQLSQADLAARLGLKKQQVQRYEATRYAGVSLQRIQDIANALGLTIREHVEFPTRSDEHGADAGEMASA